MTTKVILAGGNYTPAASAAGSVTYQPIGAYPPVSAFGNENNNRTFFREAGTLSNLYVRVTANTCNGTITYNMRENSVTKNQTLSVLTTQTGEFEDTLNTDTIVAGDGYAIQVVGTGTTGSNTVSIVRLLFSTTTDTATRLTAFVGSALTAASTTYYQGLVGKGV
jgi:hypothetical protein